MTHAYQNYVPAFPKPKDYKKMAAGEPFVTMPDGREICLKGPKGRKEYRGRIQDMLVRQEGFCCLQRYAPMCPKRLQIRNATFEHENGRTAGKHDDRIALPDGTWINGAAHLICNMWKGSRRIDYNKHANERR